MNLVVDRVMADAELTFAPLGTLRLVEGRSLAASDLVDADILLVRSVTRVDATLLAKSSVRFVGTATAGTDHIDLDYLAARDIAFSAAPGCNARPVGEFVLACALSYAARFGRRPADLAVGLIGCGHAGGAAEALLQSAGFRCLRNDPPRAEAEGGGGFASLREVLSSDIVSLHVPLTAGGSHPTHRLLGVEEISVLRRGALLINAARGGVVDESAWLDAMVEERVLGAIDCWEGEPAISPSLLQGAWLASPHVAGHSVDARRRATTQLRAALLAWRGGAAAEMVPLPSAAAPTLWLKSLRGLDALRAAVTHCVDLQAQTTVFKALLAADPMAAAARFDQLRVRFGVRREFTAQPVALQDSDPDTPALLQRCGFPARAS